MPQAAIIPSGPPPNTSNGALGSFEMGMPGPATSAAEAAYTMTIDQARSAQEFPGVDGATQMVEEAATASRMQTLRATAREKMSAAGDRISSAASTAAEVLRDEEAKAARVKLYGTIGNVALGIVERTARDAGIIHGKGDNTRFSTEGYGNFLARNPKGTVAKSVGMSAAANVKPSDVYRVGRDSYKTAKATKAAAGRVNQAKSSNDTDFAMAA